LTIYYLIIQFSKASLQSHYWCLVLMGLTLNLTARQYGEVVLPDASAEQSPGTLATKLSRCKEGMAHFLPSGYRVLRPLRASWYRVVKVLVNYPDAVKCIEGSGAVRVCQAILSCLDNRIKSKKCDNTTYPYCPC
jgi:hypothetical protein